MILIVYDILSDLISDFAQDGQRMQNDFVIQPLAYDGNSRRISIPIQYCKTILSIIYRQVVEQIVVMNTVLWV